MHQKNIEAGGLFGQCYGFKVCTGARAHGCMGARVNVILAVISGMMNPNAIGSKIGQSNGRVTFEFSGKRRINIISRFMPRRHIRLNWSGYFSTLEKDTGEAYTGLENFLR